MNTRLRFESENYYFHIYNLCLREDFREPARIQEVVNELNSYFNFKVVEILSYDTSGVPVIHYRYDYSKPLPADVDKGMKLVKCMYNDNNFERFLFSPGYKTEAKLLYALLSKYFLTKTGDEIRRFKIYETIEGGAPEIYKLRKKRKYSNQFALPHQNAYGSKIEQVLGDALTQRNVTFKMQQEIYRDGRLLTVLDFFIEEGKLAIYCDGFQYHYDKETVIKDRQQDRILQLMGYRVLRFTGSEIVGKIEECVAEIIMFKNRFSTGV